MFYAVRDTISIVKWSPGRHLLAAAGESGLFLLYDPIRQVRLQTLYLKDVTKPFRILSCSWFPSPTRKLVVLGGASGCADIWNVKSATLLHSYREHSPEVKMFPPDADPNRRTVYAVAWSPNRAYIASAGEDALVRVWRATTGETCVVCEAPLCAGHLLTWLPDSKTLVSRSGSTVFTWNAFSGHILHSIKTPLDNDQPGCHAVSPDGTKVAVATKVVVIYDLATGHILHTYRMQGNVQRRLVDSYYDNPSGFIAWSPDGTLLAVSFPQQPKLIYVWNALTGRLLFQRTSHEEVSCLDWSFDSQMLAWGGRGYLETLSVASQLTCTPSA